MTTTGRMGTSSFFTGVGRRVGLPSPPASDMVYREEERLLQTFKRKQ
jgi:hypothetical protein